MGDAPSLYRVTVAGRPDGPRAERSAAALVARALGVSLAEARALLERVPVELPRSIDEEAARGLAAELGHAGVAAGVARTDSRRRACATHPRLEASGSCEVCNRDGAVCTLCVAHAGGAWRCGACARRRRRGAAFFRARVFVLLLVLAGVVLYAWHDVRQRRKRTEWRRPLNVALVVLRMGDVAPAAIEALRDRVPVLERRFAEELRRVAGGGVPIERPFSFRVVGPVDVTTPPPALAGDGVLDVVKYTHARWRYLSGVDAAARLETKGIDSRIYVVARPRRDARRLFVEGLSEQGGRIGVVEVELESDMADFALIVAAHELLHTLGASDKYDATGKVLVPDGLAEPDLVPLFPQRFVEVMARHRPVAADTGVPPDSLDELRIGAATAREIGWLRQGP